MFGLLLEQAERLPQGIQFKFLAQTPVARCFYVVQQSVMFWSKLMPEASKEQNRTFWNF